METCWEILRRILCAELRVGTIGFLMCRGWLREVAAGWGGHGRFGNERVVMRGAANRGARQLVLDSKSAPLSEANWGVHAFGTLGNEETRYLLL
jgi:hypothetical protein